MRIAISGTSSLIGRGLIDRLLEIEQVDIRALINKTTVSINNPRLKFFNLSENKIDNFLENVDVLYHLAFDRRQLTNNIALSKNLISGIERYHVARTILCSTVSVYGTPAVKLIDETTYPEPTSPYAKTKLDVEKLFADALRAENKLLIIRPSVILYNNNVSILKTVSYLRNKKYLLLFLKRLLLKNRHTNYVSPYNVIDALVYLLVNGDRLDYKIYNVTQDDDKANFYGEIENILYSTILNSRAALNFGIPKHLLNYFMRLIPIRGTNEVFYSSRRLTNEGFVFKRDLSEDLIELAKT
jgi:nucleoside-diphosphate-sugar epimerase